MGGIAEVGDRIIEAVKDYVAGATGKINAKLTDLDARIKSIPAGADGKDADPALVHSAVAKEFDSMATVFIKGLQDE